MHIELVSASATAAAAVGSAGAAVTGDSLIVKNGRKGVSILNMWSHLQTTGFIQVSTPTSHDTTRGWKVGVVASELDLRMPLGIAMDVQPQETISVVIAENAVAGDVGLVSMLMMYEDLPGMAQRLIDWKTLTGHLEKLTTVEATLAGAAAGYTGTELVTSESDLLRANRDYAVLGISTNVECGAVCISGPDTGNVRIGVPGHDQESGMTSNFFPLIARAFNRPLIPVINSGNKASTNLSFLQNENNVSPRVTVYLGLLR